MERGQRQLRGGEAKPQCGAREMELGFQLRGSTMGGSDRGNLMLGGQLLRYCGSFPCVFFNPLTSRCVAVICFV